MRKEGWGEEGRTGRKEKQGGQSKRRRMGEARQEEGKFKHEEEKGGIEHGKQSEKEQRGPSPDPIFPHSIYYLLAYHLIYPLCFSSIPPPPKRMEALGGKGLFVYLVHGCRPRKGPGIWLGLNVYLLNK